MSSYEPGFLDLDQKDKLYYIRLALIDDPPTGALYNAALPLITTAASQVGTGLLDYVSGWWNGSSSSSPQADSTGNT